MRKHDAETLFVRGGLGRPVPLRGHLEHTARRVPRLRWAVEDEWGDVDVWGGHPRDRKKAAGEAERTAGGWIKVESGPREESEETREEGDSRGKGRTPTGTESLYISSSRAEDPSWLGFLCWLLSFAPFLPLLARRLPSPQEF